MGQIERGYRDDIDSNVGVSKGSSCMSPSMRPQRWTLSSDDYHKLELINEFLPETS